MSSIVSGRDGTAIATSMTAQMILSALPPKYPAMSAKAVPTSETSSAENTPSSSDTRVP